MRFCLAISGMALVGIVGTLAWVFPAFAMHNGKCCAFIENGCGGCVEAIPGFYVDVDPQDIYQCASGSPHDDCAQPQKACNAVWGAVIFYLDADCTQINPNTAGTNLIVNKAQCSLTGDSPCS